MYICEECHLVYISDNEPKCRVCGGTKHPETDKEILDRILREYCRKLKEDQK